MKGRRIFLNRETVTRPAQLTNSNAMWLLLTCDQGHLIKQFRRGEWTDARKRYGQKNATVLCGRCGNHNGRLNGKA